MNHLAKYFKNLPLQSALATWVGIGALSGGIISGCDKIGDIFYENQPVYSMPLIEKPIRCVYHTSRVAAHASWGSIIGATVAATAPISIPLYMYWKSNTAEKKVVKK